MLQYAVPGEKQILQKQYRNFRGVDLSSGITEIDPARSPHAPNMISDLTGFPEKRPGYRSVLEAKFTARVYGIFPYVTSGGEKTLVVHAGTKLYSMPVKNIAAAGEIKDITPAGVSMAEAPSAYFVMRSCDKNTGYKLCIYILDGANYLRFDGSTCVGVESVAYVPTTTIAAPPQGDGTKYESTNLLQIQRKNRFLSDNINYDVTTMTSGSATVVLSSSTGIKVGMMITGTNVPAGTTIINIGSDNKTITMSQNATGSRSNGTVSIGSIAYYLDTYPVDSVALVEKLNTSTANWDTIAPAAYTVDTAGGKVTFASAPEAAVGGIDNIRITFSKTVAEYADYIRQCTIATIYGIGSDNRVFVSGNPNYRNRDWMCGIGNPEYFPDDGYAVIGSENSAVMGYLKEYDSMVIMKEDSDQDASIYLRTSNVSTDGSKVTYPVKQGMVGVGAVSKWAFGVLEDDPLFLSRDGVYGLESNAITSQRSVQLRSYYVNGDLRRQEGISSACAAIWRGWYCLFTDGVAYVANSQLKNTNKTGGIGYEWFYWDNIPAVCAREFEGNLYFGTKDGDICRFVMYDECGMSAYWDNGGAYTCRWATKMDDFGDFMRCKTIMRRGTGILAKPYVLSAGRICYTTQDQPEETVREFDQNMVTFDFTRLNFTDFSLNPVTNPRVIPVNIKQGNVRLLQVIVENSQGGTGFGIYGIQVRYMYTKDVKK